MGGEWGRGAAPLTSQQRGVGGRRSDWGAISCVPAAPSFFTFFKIPITSHLVLCQLVSSLFFCLLWSAPLFVSVLVALGASTPSRSQLCDNYHPVTGALRDHPLGSDKTKEKPYKKLFFPKVCFIRSSLGNLLLTQMVSKSTLCIPGSLWSWQLGE